MIKFPIIICLSFIVTCGLEPYPATHTTPGGYRANIPAEFYEHGLYLHDRHITDPGEIDDLILGWTDSRIEEWINTQSDSIPATRLHSIAASYTYVAVDHWFFSCDYYSHGTCSGEFSRIKRSIKTAFYTRCYAWGGDYPLAPCCDYFPPHTALTGVDLMERFGYDNPDPLWAEHPSHYHYGCMPGRAKAFGSISHELDHIIGIDHKYY